MSAVLVLAIGAAMLLATPYALARSDSRAVADAVALVAGATLGVGALLAQSDVGAWSWILSPLAGGLLVGISVHALLAPGGPFRT